MMLPMVRSEVFKILSDIFRQDDIGRLMELNEVAMSESPAEPYDIDFRWECTGKLVSYLRIVNPSENCVDGEYCFVYHSSLLQKDGNIAIDSSGMVRVYGDDIKSSIYHVIVNNANRLAEYVKKLTLTYQNQVADIVVSVVKTYCDILMNKYDNIFTQLDISTSEGCCTEFLIRAMNEPERNCQFDVVKHIYEYNINDNDIWVRFSKPDGWLWTPLVIRPAIGDIVINNEQCVFTDIFNAKELAGLARLIGDQTGFAVSVRDGGSTREQNVAKYIKSLLQKHEVLDAVKQVSTEKLNNENNKNLKSIVDDAVEKKIDKFVKTGSMCFTTKDFLYSKICDQLTLWQQGIFHTIYSSIYCTLAESKYTGAAFELERRFMELVSTDKDQGFHVFFRLDKINKDLPRFDIVFDQCDAYVMIHEGDFTKTCVFINRNTDHAKVYTHNIKYMRNTYKTIVSHVASKIVLIDALS